MDRSRSFVSGLAALIVAGLFVVACDSGTQEPAAPEDPGSAAGIAKPIPDSRFPTDLPTGVTAAIPENFPDNVPIYPGSQPARGYAKQAEEMGMYALQLATMDSPSKVHEFYRTGLEASGWDLAPDRDHGEDSAIAATVGDCKILLMITPSDDGGSDIFMITEC